MTSGRGGPPSRPGRGGAGDLAGSRSDRASVAVAERFYLGTWGLGGAFGSIDRDRAVSIVRAAQHLGLTRFDTAAVYGGGAVETLLGATLEPFAVVCTKVPAVRASDSVAAQDVARRYPAGHVAACLEGSLRRLQRDRIDVALLHNWDSSWNVDCPAVEALQRAQADGRVARIGISFGDGREPPSADLLDAVDVIEAPWNANNRWIEPVLPDAKASAVEVILRSIFLHGLALKPAAARRALPNDDERRSRAGVIIDPSPDSPGRLVAGAVALGTSFAIGVTSVTQIVENVRLVRESMS